MSKARIDAGICGEYATVVADLIEDYRVSLSIESSCKHIQKLAENLDEVDALHEISARRGVPETLAKGMEFCAHAACPVPVGIIKAIEVAAGLALPKDVQIKIES